MRRIVLYPSIALVAATTAGASNAGQGGAFQPHNPTAFAKPFAAELQQFQALPQNQPPRPVDAQFQRAQPPEVFAKPFPVTAQQWSAFQPAGRINSFFPQGFFGQQWDTRFAKPFPVTAQQYSPAPSPQLFSTVRFGWWGFQLDARFAKPFPAASQQFNAIFKYPDVAPPLGWWGIQYDYRFVAPYPAAQQQWSAFQPQGEVPPYLPPGAGKKQDFPSWIPQPARDATPAKKFRRPVWDKPPAIEAPPLEQAAPQPAPLPPPGIFAPRPQGPAFTPPAINPGLPPDPMGLAKRLQQARDMSDAIAVLKKIGLLS